MSITFQHSNRFRWLHDLVFSLYCSLLFVWFEESRPFAWSTKGRYLYLWHPHAVSLSPIDLLLFYAAIIFIPAALILTLVKIVRKLGFPRMTGRIVCGFVAIAGLPLACLYRGSSPYLLPEMIAVAAAVWFLLWVGSKVTLSASVNVVVLFVYYVLCVVFGVAAYLVTKPYASWGRWDYAWLIYPVIGFVYSLIWLGYFGPGDKNERQIEVALA